MPRKRVNPANFVCWHCHKTTKYHPNPNPRGLCNPCKHQIMRRWNQVPYKTRVIILEQLVSTNNLSWRPPQ